MLAQRQRLTTTMASTTSSWLWTAGASGQLGLVTCSAEGQPVAHQGGFPGSSADVQ